MRTLLKENLNSAYDLHIFTSYIQVSKVDIQNKLVLLGTLPALNKMLPDVRGV